MAFIENLKAGGSTIGLEIHAPENPSCSLKANYKQEFRPSSDGKASSWDTLVSTIIPCLELPYILSVHVPCACAFKARGKEFSLKEPLMLMLLEL